MATETIYNVEQARALLATIRATLLRVAVERRTGGDLVTLQALLDHLGSLGVVVRDLDGGLVDIPTMRDGERAWLCWRLEDPALEWWHTTSEGFTSRRPL